MKLFIKPAAFLALIILMGGCSKDNHTTIPKRTTVKHTNSTGISFSPSSGINYSAVTIIGNFSTVPGENLVKFNGVTGIINSVTATQIVATVPALATTGKISVVTNGVTTTTAADFKVLKMVKTISIWLWCRQFLF